jgi:hypothetical protein
MCSFSGTNIDFPEARPEIYGLESVPSAHRRGEVASLFLPSRIFGIRDASAAGLAVVVAIRAAAFGERL